VDELQSGDPRRIGPYWLEGRLGAGGMGRVYLGRSPGGRRVAIKAIRAELSENADFRARFAREVSAARKVSGIYTAAVVDADLDGPVPWLATSYVAGPSLADAVARDGPLPAAAVLRLAAGLAEGLDAIHRAGVAHRDLKPANVILADDGPRLIDFGISRSAEMSALTHTGTVLGSPGFMSPEQAEGVDAGPPSDIFSLGAVLAFAATGEGPFGTGSTPALLYRVVTSQPATGTLPGEIRPMIESCLAKDPRQRPTAAGLLAQLSAAQSSSTPAAHPPAGERRSHPAPPAAPGAATGPGGPQGHPATEQAASDLPRPSIPAWEPTLTTPHPHTPTPQPPGGQEPQPRPGQPSRRGRRTALVAAAVIAAAAAGAGAWAAVLHHKTRPPAAAQPTTTSTPAPAPTATTVPPAPLGQPADVAVVNQFFSDLNNHDYAGAWNLGGDNISNGAGYSTWVNGYSTTSSMSWSARDLGNGLVTVNMSAAQTDGSTKTYTGTYTVSNGMIVSADVTQTGGPS